MSPQSILLSTVLGVLVGAVPEDKEKSPQGPTAAHTEFVIQSEFGTESDWVKPYLDRAARELVRLLDNPAVTPPSEVIVILKKDPTSRGMRGVASGHKGTLSFSSSIWPQERFRLWMTAHELVLLFTAHYAGAGGFPRDWWDGDGRASFPLYVSCLLMKRLGFEQEAEATKAWGAADKERLLFWDLDRRYGFPLFAEFFKLLRDDGIDLAQIGARWPAPDQRRSTYTIAYLSLAARRNLTANLQPYGIGRKPNGWEKRYPTIPFVEYEVSAEDVTQLVRVRQRLFGKHARPEDDSLRQAYRKGEYEEVLKKMQ